MSVLEYTILYKTTIIVHVSPLPVNQINLLVILTLADYSRSNVFLSVTIINTLIVFRCDFTALFFSN